VPPTPMLTGKKKSLKKQKESTGKEHAEKQINSCKLRLYTKEECPISMGAYAISFML
jgi:hypothetical protein